VSGVSFGYLFGAMLREDWRLHARLFGGRRFALFPAFLTLLAAGTAAFFAVAGADESVLLAGLHVVVGLVGLQVGSIGLVGRDALENLLGDTTLLLYAARTLPVSSRRLLVAFVLTDVAYYAVLFVAPLALGVVPLVVLGSVPAARLPVVLATAWLAFGFGVGLSLALVGLSTVSRAATLAAVGGVIGAGVFRPGLLVGLTPYGLFVHPTPAAAVGSTVVPLVLGTVGVRLFSVERETPARTASNQFRALYRRLAGLDEAGTLTKSLLDVGRSSGGLWKVVFSQGLVFAVVVVLLAYLPGVVPVRPSPGLTLAAVLALGAFTTYNWLCQFEDEAFWGALPVDLSTVFRAKLLAYLLLSVPTGLFYLALGTWLFGVETTLLGAAVYLPLVVYVFGLTAFVAGLRPTELLFDTPVFALFSAAMMAVLMPLVVLAIAYPLAPAAVTGGAVALSVAAGGIGLLLSGRAGPRWAARARRG